MPPHLATWAQHADMTSLPTGLMLAVRQYLSRLPTIDPTSRVTIGARLADEVLKYVAPEPPPRTAPEDFLAAVIASRRERDLSRLRRQSEFRRAADHPPVTARLRAPGDVLVHLRRARDHADRCYAGAASTSSPWPRWPA